MTKNSLSARPPTFIGGEKRWSALPPPWPSSLMVIPQGLFSLWPRLPALAPSLMLLLRDLERLEFFCFSPRTDGWGRFFSVARIFHRLSIVT